MSVINIMVFSKALHTLRFYIAIWFEDSTIDILAVCVYVYMLRIIAFICFPFFYLFPN